MRGHNRRKKSKNALRSKYQPVDKSNYPRLQRLVGGLKKPK